MKTDTVGDAVADRIIMLLGEGNIKSYFQLAKNACIPYGTIKSILQRRVKDVKLKTIILIAESLGITVAEFLDDDSFSAGCLDL